MSPAWKSRQSNPGPYEVLLFARSKELLKRHFIAARIIGNGSAPGNQCRNASAPCWMSMESPFEVRQPHAFAAASKGVTGG